MAYDSIRQELVMFGGFAPLRTERCPTSGGPLGGCNYWTVYEELTDTWTWDGDIWTEQHPAGQPLPVYSTQPSNETRGFGSLQMAFDELSGRCLLVRSDSPGSQLNWWDGATWASDVAPELSRLRYALIGYDEFSKRLVLFGGSGDNDDVATYVWDGKRWSGSADVGAPRNASFSQFGGVVYDSHSRELLFNLDGRIWSLNGRQWASRDLLPGSLAWGYDRARSQVVTLVGGNNNVVETYAGSTFQLQKVKSAHTPVYRVGAAVGYHPKHSALILFGGEEPNLTYK